MRRKPWQAGGGGDTQEGSDPCGRPCHHHGAGPEVFHQPPCRDRAEGRDDQASGERAQRGGSWPAGVTREGAEGDRKRVVEGTPADDLGDAQSDQRPPQIVNLPYGLLVSAAGAGPVDARAWEASHPTGLQTSRNPKDRAGDVRRS